MIDPKIFKAYDIRGLVSEITPEIAERVGRALVEYTGATTVIVGRDMRETSPGLLQSVIKGVTLSGAQVIDIGLTSTPMFYYATGWQLAADPAKGAGIMVTASHNPKEYNGFKLERGNVTSIGEGSGMEEIRDLAIAGKFVDRPKGNVTEVDVREKYVAQHLAIVSRRSIGSPTVVFDAGNGMSGYVTPGIIKAYGLGKKCVQLFFDLDGSFPNHVPNPAKPENMKWASEAVVKHGADLGVVYDGDSDRVGFIDETGTIVRGDLITAILATEVLRDYPGASVVHDLVSSKAVQEAIIEANGNPVVCRVGHAFFKEKMHETDACFGGEASTHYYFKDFYSAESSDLAMLMILRAMKRTGKKLSELAAPLRRYRHSGEINFTVRDKEGLFRALNQRYETRANETLRLGGVHFIYPTWWLDVRPSNTEPLVRLNVEAETEEEMKERVEEVTEIIKEF